LGNQEEKNIWKNPRHRWDDNIIKNFKEIRYGDVAEFIRLRISSNGVLLKTLLVHKNVEILLC
jgi:hypothetical protein